MPNLWSNATQKIYETIMGPRTKDMEFENKMEELRQMEKSIYAIKSAYHNFSSSTSGKILF